MKSIRDIFKIGKGPSSSHSMGPRKAAELFKLRLRSEKTSVTVELYGSLAATGKGHLTDLAIREGLYPYKVKIVFRPETELERHPNSMSFIAFDQNKTLIDKWTVYSIGGSNLADDFGPVAQAENVEYPFEKMTEILTYCNANNISLFEFISSFERQNLMPFLSQTWTTMEDAIKSGLSKRSLLPGPLRLKRRAEEILVQANDQVGLTRDMNLISAYALAVAEENASGNTIVTAPTCGSCGVLPSILFYFKKHSRFSEEAILKAMAVAGLFGSAVEKGASLSGAQVGCQGEIGTACAMASAAACYLLGANNNQIEYAAEMAMEHNLGLTCDPIAGLVQIPCIERNAFAATRALTCATYAMATDGKHRISFDDVIKVMDSTGRDLQSKYRETAQGGLAVVYLSK